MKPTILSFGAHPDDIEIGCGGTERLFIQQGYQVIHVVLTSGESGSLETSPEQLRAIRESEAQLAAKSLGVQEVMFLRYPDGLTHFTREMKIHMIQLLRSLRPEIVFMHSSEDGFPDHRVVYQLLLSAIQAAAGPWYQEASGMPHYVNKVFGYEVWQPLSRVQYSVDITSVIEAKLDAIRCHRSQMTPIAYDDAFLGLARYRGAMGLKSKFAEAFEVIQC